MTAEPRMRQAERPRRNRVASQPGEQRVDLVVRFEVNHPACCDVFIAAVQSVHEALALLLQRPHHEPA